MVDLGGGPRNRHIVNGVALYFHDYPHTGEVTKVVSPANPEMLSDGDYQTVKGFTGKDVRATVVHGVAFPTLLNPVDDLPPASMIRSVKKSKGGLIVTGVSEDNGDVKSVRVNGEGARIMSEAPGVVQWEARIALPADGLVTAAATDEAGNAETYVHRIAGVR